MGGGKAGEPASPLWDSSVETLLCDTGGRAASCPCWRGQPGLGGLGGGSGVLLRLFAGSTVPFGGGGSPARFVWLIGCGEGCSLGMVTDQEEAGCWHWPSLCFGIGVQPQAPGTRLGCTVGLVHARSPNADSTEGGPPGALWAALKQHIPVSSFGPAGQPAFSISSFPPLFSPAFILSFLPFGLFLVTT